MKKSNDETRDTRGNEMVCVIVPEQERKYTKQTQAAYSHQHSRKHAMAAA
jgi:hypothetical protein